MADRSVVVSKSGPMKAGNRLEEKTRTSMRLGIFFFLEARSQKKKKKWCRIPCSHSKRGETEAKGTCFVKDCEYS